VVGWCAAEETSIDKGAVGKEDSPLFISHFRPYFDVFLGGNPHISHSPNWVDRGNLRVKGLSKKVGQPLYFFKNQ
jgi:hypothetical protein